jgi:hypothetical protein
VSGQHGRQTRLTTRQAWPARRICLVAAQLCVLIVCAAGTLGASEAGATPLAWSTLGLADEGPHPANALLSDSCPSTALCVATDESGHIVTSTEPTGGEEAWSAPVSIDPGHPLESVACPSSKLCIAVDPYGSAFYSTNPTGGPTAWHQTAIDPNLSAESGFRPRTLIACPTTKLCVVSTGTNELVTSTEPTGTASAWHVASNPELSQGRFTSLACASESMCVVDYTVDECCSAYYSATAPTGGWSGWKHTGNDPAGIGGLTALTCPTTSLCVGGSFVNEIVTSTAPATGPWSDSTP